MSKRQTRKLPTRESVFIASLLWHGYRLTSSRTNLKFRRGYVVPSTMREDAGGIDVWVKVPNSWTLVPVQVTQRGTKIYRLLQNRLPSDFQDSRQRLAELEVRSRERIRQKQRRCARQGIAFVLVRDFIGGTTNPTIAWGDLKSLRYGIANLKGRS